MNRLRLNRSERDNKSIEMSADLGILETMNERFGVRKGFLFGAMIGFFVAGSMLWAIPVVTTYMPRRFSEPNIVPESFMPIPRGTVPSALAWFSIQYPYVAQSATT